MCVCVCVCLWWNWVTAPVILNLDYKNLRAAFIPLLRKLFPRRPQRALCRWQCELHTQCGFCRVSPALYQAEVEPQPQCCPACTIRCIMTAVSISVVKTIQEVYLWRFIEPCSFNNSCSEWTIIITCFGCVFVAWGIEPETRMRHNIICDLSGCTFFSLSFHVRRRYRKNDVFFKILFSIKLLSVTFLILRRSELDITNTYWSWCNEPVYFLSFSETWISSIDFRKIRKYVI